MKPDIHAVGFGFYGVDPMKPGYSEEVLASDYINVAFAYGPVERMTESVRRIREQGKTCWLGTYDYVFVKQPDGRSALQPAFRENLTRLMDALAEAGVDDCVRGIYFDEPFLCRVGKEDFIEATKFYRTTYPEKGIYICFSVTPLCPELWDPGYPVPLLDEESCRYLTDVGYDFYDDYADNVAWYEKLTARLYEVTKNLDVRYWFTPCAMCYKGRSTEQNSIEQTNALYEMLKASPRPGGIMCYSYWTIPPELENLGNINLDILFDESNPNRWSRYQARLMEIGREIVGGFSRNA